MRYGVPIIGERVAPRCIYANGFLVISTKEGGVVHHHLYKATIRTPADLTEALTAHNVETLITGGVGEAVRHRLGELNVAIVDNISNTVEELLDAVVRDRRFRIGGSVTVSAVTGAACLQHSGRSGIDCLECTNRSCFDGENLSTRLSETYSAIDTAERQIMEAAFDIASESPRQLCRLAEVIYFCLEMGYGRVGLAYCTELEDAAGILAKVLKRFFSVVPVCCKIGGISEAHLFSDGGAWRETDSAKVVCNPIGQAQALNDAKTEFNIVVGLCVGMDALFFRNAEAPSTPLFVKDKSLANNPIGALYSEYYLNETVSKAPKRHTDKQKTNRPEES